MATRPVRDRKSVSQFADALRQILDETLFFKREEWARFLGVSASAISQWVHDKTLPRPDLLRQILDVLRNSADVPAGPLSSFDAIAHLAATDVSPLGERMLPSVSTYMRRATFSNLGREIRDLSPSEQYAVLQDGSWPVRSKVPEVKPHFVDFVADESKVDRVSVLPHLETLVLTEGKRERVSWESVRSRLRVAIVGTPGCGKSHALRILKRFNMQRGRPVPLFFAASEVWKEPNASQFLDGCRSAAGRACDVFIDGLDEVPTNLRSSVVDEVAEACRLFPSLRILIATRPIPELAALDDFEMVAMAPLTNVQTILCLDRALQSNRGLAMSEELERFVCHFAEREPLYNSMRTPLFMKTAASLFARTAVTPFSETEVVGEYFRCLLDGWDREKSVVRARKPWASFSRLQSVLAELCFHLVRAQKTEFETHDAEHWLLPAANCGVPLREILDLLSIQSGVFNAVAPNRWQISHRYFLLYLAAMHIVASAEGATTYFRDWTKGSSVRDVFPLACGITSDATPLLKWMLRKEHNLLDAERSVLLCEALAQPISAQSSVLENSCDVALDWLDVVFSRWKVSENVAAESGAVNPVLWELRATGAIGSHDRDQVSRALKAVHRARSGPARTLLIERMQDRCSVLAEFSKALEVEGRLSLDVTTRRRTALKAIVAPVSDVG